MVAKLDFVGLPIAYPERTFSSLVGLVGHRLGETIVTPAEQTGKDVMTIYPLFSNHAFGPEKLEDMSRAYEAVCNSLGVKLTDGHATQAVAEKIIEYAQRGVGDVATLRSLTLESFKAKT